MKITKEDWVGDRVALNRLAAGSVVELIAEATDMSTKIGDNIVLIVEGGGGTDEVRVIGLPTGTMMVRKHDEIVRVLEAELLLNRLSSIHSANILNRR